MASSSFASLSTTKLENLATSLQDNPFLVIFDVDGVLCARCERDTAKRLGWDFASKQDRSPALALRPGIKDMLALLRSHNVRIATWSSMQEKNLKPVLDKLLLTAADTVEQPAESHFEFMWYRARCTIPPCGRGSLKPLSAVFEAHAGTWHCGNTLIVDNSERKLTVNMEASLGINCIVTEEFEVDKEETHDVEKLLADIVERIPLVQQQQQPPSAASTSNSRFRCRRSNASNAEVEE